MRKNKHNKNLHKFIFLMEGIYYATNIMYTWGRICTNNCKEKYGYFDSNIRLWDGTIFSLIWPNRIFVPKYWPYYSLDFKIIAPVLQTLGIVYLFNRYQLAVYNYAIQKICKHFPFLTNEFVYLAQYKEYIKPGYWGKVDAIVVHANLKTKFKNFFVPNNKPMGN